MATEKRYYMTKEGKDNLEAELHELRAERRQEGVERIQDARAFGELSENSEYDAAEDEQAFVDTRLAQVETMLRNAIIIENDNENPAVETLGNTVTFQELPDGDKETYTIVGSAEADPFEGKISNDSPMAKSLLGHEKGEEVTVSTPGGDMQVKVVHVE